MSATKTSLIRRASSALLLASLSSPLAAIDYLLLDLGQQQGTFSEVNGMNNAGIVVGEDGDHAVVYEYGEVTDLGAPDGMIWSRAMDIDDAGVVVGSANATSGTDGTRGFVYEDGEFTLIPTLGGDFSMAFGINNRRQVVGGTELTGKYENVAVRYDIDSQSLTILDTRDVERRISVARAINDAGVAAGSVIFDGGNRAARFLPGGGVNDLGVLAGNQSGATDINDRGIVVGESKYDPALARFHAFRDEGGQMTDLGSLSDFDSRAMGINNRGEIVGYSVRFGRDHAFRFRDGMMKDLNDLVIMGGLGWTLTRAMAVNDYGQIAGQGSYQEQVHAFLLTPIAIHIELQAGGLRLSWSELLTDYRLQTTDDLSQAGSWRDHEAVPVEIDHRRVILIQAEEQTTGGYYRLAGP